MSVWPIMRITGRRLMRWWRSRWPKTSRLLDDVPAGWFFTGRLFEQCDKSGLLEMFVTGQRVRHVTLAHDDERHAIGQRPLLVRVLVIQIERTIQQFAGRRDDFTGG